MRSFAIGDAIVCIEPSVQLGLTFGQIYLVKDVVILDDVHEYVTFDGIVKYNAKRFSHFIPATAIEDLHTESDNSNVVFAADRFLKRVVK